MDLRDDFIALTKVIEFHRFSDSWTQLRFVGSMKSVFEMNVEVKDRWGGVQQFTKFSVDWDPEEHRMSGNKCPYRKRGSYDGRACYYSNAIIRRLQKEMPESLPEHTEYELRFMDADPHGSNSSWFGGAPGRTVTR